MSIDKINNNPNPKVFDTYTPSESNLMEMPIEIRNVIVRKQKMESASTHVSDVNFNFFDSYAKHILEPSSQAPVLSLNEGQPFQPEPFKNPNLVAAEFVKLAASSWEDKEGTISYGRKIQLDFMDKSYPLGKYGKHSFSKDEIIAVILPSNNANLYSHCNGLNLIEEGVCQVWNCFLKMIRPSHEFNDKHL